MNKKAKANLSTYLNQALVYGFIALIIFLIVGGGGGFSKLLDIGKTLGKIPAWMIIAFFAVIAFRMWSK